MHFPFYTKILFTLALILLTAAGCYREEELQEIDPAEGSKRVLAFDGIYAFTDISSGLLLYHLSGKSLTDFSPEVKFGSYQQILFDGQALIKGESNLLPSLELNQRYPVLAQTGNRVDSFELVFTSLPILQFITKEEIPDEYKVNSFMELQYSGQGTSAPTRLFSSHAGIEIRGQSARRFEKSAYGIELWNNWYRDDRKESLLGMRICEDWILDAMYIDDLRLRHKLSYEVWKKTASIPYPDVREDVYPGIDLEYVEVFINNSYYGLYCLGEKMNEDVLCFADGQEDVGGVIYKAWDYVDSSTMFYKIHSEPSMSDIWDGWEIIYPKKSIQWDPLSEFVKTVVWGDDRDFAEKIPDMIDLQIAADYYLFMNLLKGIDNTGKNIFYARYTEDSPFFIIPWDLDATWGKRFDKRNSSTNGVLTNNLYIRLLALDVEDFKELIAQRWDQHRQGAFHEDSIMALVDRYYGKVRESGAMKRELDRWPELEIDAEAEYSYISTWISTRLNILDREFSKEK